MPKNSVEPGVNPAFYVQSLVEFAHYELILRGMAEEDSEETFFGRHRNLPTND